MQTDHSKSTIEKGVSVNQLGAWPQSMRFYMNNTYKINTTL